MLQELVDEIGDADGVWFTHGAELARHALSDAAGIGTDGRPRPDGAKNAHQVPDSPPERASEIRACPAMIEIMPM